MKTQHSEYDILNSLTDSALVIDHHYTVIFVNQSYMTLFGVRQEEVVGQKCHKISHKCSSPCDEICLSAMQNCPHKQVFKSGRAVTIQHSHPLPDGSQRIFQISVSPQLDEKGDCLSNNPDNEGHNGTGTVTRSKYCQPS